MNYDIAIIGAGPAGSMFAKQVCSSGKRVLLIDAQKEENRKPCGGLLSPDAQKVFAHLNLVLPKYILADPQIFSVKTIDICEKMITYYQRFYLNMDRYAFDKWLLSLVPNCVDIIEGKCLKILKENETFKIFVKENGQENVYISRQIVGADGAKSLVRKSFFKKEAMHYVAIQEWYNAPKNMESRYSCIFDKTTSESCSWIIPKDNAFIFGGCFSSHDCKKAFDKQKERVSKFLNLDLSSPIKKEACLALRPKRMSDFTMAKDGVYLIGEAAGFISASSFEGISYAMRSALLLADAFLKNSEEEKITKAYIKNTFKMRLKLMIKTKKRWFMYTPIIRKIIMKSGLSTIHIRNTK